MFSLKKVTILQVWFSQHFSKKMSIHHDFSWYWPWIAETTIFNVKNHHFSAGDRLLHPLFGEGAHREERHLKALATRQWCKWWADDSLIYTRWCPKTLAKLVPVTPITMTTTACWSGPAPKIGREHWGSRQSRLRYLKCSRPTRIPSRITHWLHSGTVEGRATLHTTGVRVGRSGISWPHSSTFAECISGRCYQALNVEDGYIMIYR